MLRLHVQSDMLIIALAIIEKGGKKVISTIMNI